MHLFPTPSKQSLALSEQTMPIISLVGIWSVWSDLAKGTILGCGAIPPPPPSHVLSQIKKKNHTQEPVSPLLELAVRISEDSI